MARWEEVEEKGEEEEGQDSWPADGLWRLRERSSWWPRPQVWVGGAIMGKSLMGGDFRVSQAGGMVLQLRVRGSSGGAAACTGYRHLAGMINLTAVGLAEALISLVTW